MTPPVCPVGLKSKFDVSRESWEKLEAYVGLLAEWQTKINLVSPSTMPDIWERHIADSLQLLRLIPAETTHIVDLGSGGGLPGIVLAATLNAKVQLIESNGKKVAFLRTALRAVGGHGVVHQIRIENLPDLPCDVVTARAFAPLAKLLSLASPLLLTGATGLFHKGENLDAELTKACKCWKLDAIRHQSLIDSQSTILEIRKIDRVG